VQTFLEELDKQQATGPATPKEELISLYFYAVQHQNRFLLEVSDSISLRALKRRAANEIKKYNSFQLIAVVMTVLTLAFSCATLCVRTGR
jgi:hypothetical protein